MGCLVPSHTPRSGAWDVLGFILIPKYASSASLLGVHLPSAQGASLIRVNATEFSPERKGLKQNGGALPSPHPGVALLGGRPALSRWCGKALRRGRPAFLCLVPAPVCASRRRPFRCLLSVLLSGRYDHTPSRHYLICLCGAWVTWALFPYTFVSPNCLFSSTRM